MRAIIHNVEPVIDIGSDQVICEGDLLTPIKFNDKGTLDTHTAEVDWGDVAEKVLLKQDVQMEFASSGSAEDVMFRAGQGAVDDDTGVLLQAGGTYLGTYLAPYSKAKLGADAVLDGALYGRKVDIGNRAQITGKTARDLFALFFVNP